MAKLRTDDAAIERQLAKRAVTGDIGPTAPLREALKRHGIKSVPVAWCAGIPLDGIGRQLNGLQAVP